MPRDIPIGNGSMLVTFDRDYVMRDFFFPEVGGENHTIGHPCRFGVWVDGQFSWMGPEWQKELRYMGGTLVLAEQVNPYTNAPLSVSPLTWSHAAFISAVLEYLEKRQALDGPNGMTAADGEVSSPRHAARGHPGGRSRARQNLPTPHTESS